ncbi:MAG: tyrosine-type recombinase/integrase [Dissulfurispiraceae bacterium]
MKVVPEAQPKKSPKQKRQEELFELTLNGFANLSQSQRFQDSNCASTLAAVKEFQQFSGKFPWKWTRDNFEAYSAYLFKVLGNSASTQRAKQRHIKHYTEYLISSQYKTVIQKEFGIILEAICLPRENMIVHKVQNDNETKRRDLTSAELNEFFDKMDDEILLRFNSAHKGLRSAQRDKALFGVLADYGLRGREITKLDITDIGPNPDFPQFKNYGYIDVWFGKATKGSNPIYRRVWTLDLRAAQNLEWYVESVRPHFIREKTTDIKALFYSERGTRLSVRSIEMNCKGYLCLFEMYEEGLVPHSFRHSYSTVNQEGDGVSANLMQRQLGHAELSTTQKYTHFSEPAVKKFLDDAIQTKLEKHKRRQLDEDA